MWKAQIKFSALAVVFLFLISLGYCAALSSSIEVYVPESSHTVVFPLERSFIFTVKIKNLDDQERIVSFDSSPVEAPDWLVILPAGRVMLPREEKSKLPPPLSL